jgi:peptide/nickel transport system substrate-binding protein
MLQDETVNRDPLAFGPFKVDEWIAGDRISLSKNPTYYRASEGLPKLDKLIYRFVPDTNQLIAQLASGECDLGTQDAAFEGSLPLIRQFEAQGLLIPQVVAGTVYEHLDFNTLPVEGYTGFAASVKNADGSPIFANVEIRQAIAYCLDKQAIVDQTTNGAAVVQHVFIPADHPLYAGDENITILPFDPAKGMELLAKNGWTDSDGDGWLDDGKGNKFSFVHSTRTNALRQKVTQVVQAQLKENCMIETSIEFYGAEFFADGPDGPVFGRQYDLGEFAWLTGVEPPCNLYNTSSIPQDGNWGGQNNTGWSNAEFDAACGAANSALDEAVKAEQHAKAQKIFSDNLPSIILFARAKILVTRPEITGVVMDATANSELWNVENFDINLGQ